MEDLTAVKAADKARKFMRILREAAQREGIKSSILDGWRAVVSMVEGGNVKGYYEDTAGRKYASRAQVLEEIRRMSARDVEAARDAARDPSHLTEPTEHKHAEQAEDGTQHKKIDGGMSSSYGWKDEEKRTLLRILESLKKSQTLTSTAAVVVKLQEAKVSKKRNQLRNLVRKTKNKTRKDDLALRCIEAWDGCNKARARFASTTPTKATKPSKATKSTKPSKATKATKPTKPTKPTKSTKSTTTTKRLVNVVVDAVKKLCEGRRFRSTSAPAIFKAVSSTMDVSHVAFRRALWDAQKCGLLSSRKPHFFFYRQVSYSD